MPQRLAGPLAGRSAGSLGAGASAPRGWRWLVEGGALLLAVASVSALGACRDLPQGHLYTGPLHEPVGLPACTPASGETPRWCLEEAEGPVDNPGQGLTTFHDFNDDHDRSTHPFGGVAYLRHYWNELEPTEGDIRFDLLDDALARAEQNGQVVAWRLMAESGSSTEPAVPPWLVEQAGGAWAGREGSAAYYSPDYDDEAFLAAVERTLQALGDRYDGDPRLHHVDIGVAGNAGEWSFTNDDEQMPSPENAERIIDAHFAAFPRTRLVMLVGHVDDEARPVRYAVGRGAGWRADCWGDLGSGWNHHDDFYDRRIDEEGELAEVWRTAPVALETCGEMETWALLGYQDDQIRWLLHWALERHASVVNNKSRSVPEAWRGMVDEFLTWAGARLVASSLSLVASTEDPGAWDVEVELTNRGVAPLYRDAWLELRLGADGQDEVRVPLTGEASSARATSWLPGTHVLTGVTPALPAATWRLSLAVVRDDGGIEHHLAHEGTEGGWTPVGSWSSP